MILVAPVDRWQILDTSEIEFNITGHWTRILRVCWSGSLLKPSGTGSGYAPNRHPGDDTLNRVVSFWLLGTIQKVGWRTWATKTEWWLVSGRSTYLPSILE